MKTKDRILTEALKLFSEKGYEAVGVIEIAEAVGIKAPSLYKHFSGKQAIFDAILGFMNQRYQALAASLQLNGAEASQDLPLIAAFNENQLVEMGRDLFLHHLEDEYSCHFRRLLTRELHKSSELAKLYEEQFIRAPLAYQTALFSGLMAMGIFKNSNPEVAALQFYAPIPLLLSLCDGLPENEPKALRLLEEHIRAFDQMHRKECDTQANEGVEGRENNVD